MMRYSLSTLTLLALLSPLSQAATVTALGATVSTFVSDNTPTIVDATFTAVDPTDPTSLPDPFEVGQTADFQGNGGNAIVDARLDDLNYYIPDGAGTIGYTGTNFGFIAVQDDSRSPSPNAQKIDIASSASYSISFELAPGETRLAALDLTYRVFIDNDVQNNATVSWELVSPSNTKLGITDSIDYMQPVPNDPYQETEMISQSTIINQAGIYTFNLTAEIPEQEFQNSKKDVVIILDDINVRVTNIPEPSAVTMLALASCGLLLRRRR
ncbi:PEP-CTERM sorting domain-containing protein [Rubritalea tangerina]